MLKLRIRVIDPETTADLTGLLDAAFGGEAESRLVAALRVDSLSWIPELSLGAFDDDRLVGYALLSRVYVGENKIPALSFAPLAIAPNEQRRGVGGFLTLAAVSAARRAGEGVIVVLGHPEYYPRFGFRPAAEQGILSPWNVPEEAWMYLDLREGASADMSGVVSYPSAVYDAL